MDRIDVCICTYRRPQISETLKAVAAQHFASGRTLRVIVADNAPAADAREAISAVGAQLGLDLLYVHAPARNISIARNACLDAARGDWIAFLDDDEIPAPTWLEELLAEARRGDWDAVLGPVQAIYPKETARWISSGDFHSTRPVWVRGVIETGYTGNVLLRRRLIDSAPLRFREEFGRSGGEDLDFFYRLRDAGGTIGFAPAALAYEAVSPDRMSLAWLVRRSFRRGQSHGVRLHRSSHQWLDRLRNLAVALGKAVALGLAAACQIKTLSRNRCLTRAALHCGVVARLAGWSEIELY
jgi:succinoglycan biosynthesis protein ExoM